MSEQSFENISTRYSGNQMKYVWHPPLFIRLPIGHTNAEPAGNADDGQTFTFVEENSPL